MLHKVASTADPERIAVDHLRAALAQLRRLPHRAYLASVIDFTVAALQSKEDFGEMLHRRRKAAGWSPEELAEKVGLAPNTIRNMHGVDAAQEDVAAAQLAAPTTAEGSGPRSLSRKRHRGTACPLG